MAAAAAAPFHKSPDAVYNALMLGLELSSAQQALLLHGRGLCLPCGVAHTEANWLQSVSRDKEGEACSAYVTPGHTCKHMQCGPCMRCHSAAQRLLLNLKIVPRHRATGGMHLLAGSSFPQATQPTAATRAAAAAC